MLYIKRYILQRPEALVWRSTGTALSRKCLFALRSVKYCLCVPPGCDFIAGIADAVMIMPDAGENGAYNGDPSMHTIIPQSINYS
jgi:hypothetical protein